MHCGFLLCSRTSIIPMSYWLQWKHHLATNTLVCTSTTLSPVSAVQLAYLFVCSWPCPGPLLRQVQHFRQFPRSSLPTFSCVVGLAPDHFCAQVHHFRQFLRSSLPTCSCVVGLAPGHFVHRYINFASLCGPTCLLFRVLLALPRPTFLHRRVVFVNV